MVAASGSTKPRIAVAVGAVAAAVVGQVAPVVVVPVTVAVAAAATDLAAPADRVVPDPVVRGAIIVVPPVADPRS